MGFMRRSLILLVASALVAVVAPSSVGAQAGDGVRPDPSFGNGLGYVTLELSGQTTLASAALTTPDGGIVVAGQADSSNGNGQVLVAKYDSTGQLDPGFATEGVFVSSFPQVDGPFIATTIARDSCGRLLVAGGYGQGSVLVMRLTADGQVDTTFGTDGLTTIEVGGIAESMAIQGDGRILVGASNGNADGRPMVVARLTAEGDIDSSFGTNGKTDVLFWDSLHAASAGVTGLAVAKDGKIVGSGHIDYIGGDGHGSAGIFRLTSSGHLDPDYGAGGGVEVAFTNPDGSFVSWFPCAMTLDADGRATVTGDGTPAAGNAVLTTRVTAAGIPDPSFGAAGDGRAVIAGSSGGEDTTCGAADDDGVFTLGAGASLAQLLPDGSPNADFAPGGITNVETPADVAIAAVVLTGRGTAVFAGTAGNNLYVGRFLLPTSQGADTQATEWVPLGGPYGTDPSALTKCDVVFAVGPSGEPYYHQRSGNQWSAAIPLDGLLDSGVAPAETLVGPPKPNFEIVGNGIDGAVWYRTRDTGWQSLGGMLVSNPTAVTFDAQTYVFGVGLDDAVWYRTPETSWASLGGVIISDLGVTADGTNLYVTGVGLDDAIWVQTLSGGTWHGWSSLGGAVTSAPVTTNAAGTGYLFTIGGDGAVWYQGITDGTWSGWYGLGGIAVSAPAAVTHEDGRIDVYVVGEDLGMWLQQWNSSQWSGWHDQGGGFVSNPTVSRTEVFGIGFDDLLYAGEIPM
jgi:uncharacterized delta-60 repeat protein